MDYGLWILDFYKIFLKALYEIRTRVVGFKVLSDNHYTKRANDLINIGIFYAPRGVRTLASLDSGS